MNRNKVLKPLLFIGGVFIFSLVIKLKNVKDFLGKDNVLSCFDCFWYARLSKELDKGIYSFIDYLRNVPDFVVNLYPPPLVSLLPYGLSKITGYSLETFFVLVPPITSVLFIFPLYFWLRKFAPIHIFLGGAILGIFNLIYFNRTTLGRLDTDSMILFFIFLMFIFLTKAVYEKEKSYFWIVISSIIFNIFMWWYYKPIFSLFFILSLGLGLLFARESIKSIFYKTSLFILLTNPIFFINSIFKYTIGYFKGYLLKEATQILPFSVTTSITELQPVNFSHLVTYTTDNPFTVIIAFIGLILLFYRHFRYMIIALPILFIGLTTFLAGNRFIIYLAPFLGMGLGYAFYLFFELLKKRYPNLIRVSSVISIILVVFFSFPAQRLYANPHPIVGQKVWNDFKKIKPLLQENSYIWTWWDYGNILNYTFNKGTYTGNQDFNPIKIYFFAHSMMVYDEDKARNLIAFITNNYYRDYGTNIKTLTDTWNLKDKAYEYNEPLTKPVYVFIFGDMMGKTFIHNLGVFGMNIYDENVASVSTFTKCSDKGTFYNCGLFIIQKNTEKLNWSKEALAKNPPYKEIIFIRRTDLIVFKKVLYKNENYPHDRMLEIIESKNGMYFVIANRKIKNSMLNRMFIFRDSFRNFELIFDDFPELVVYKVVK